MIIKKLNTVFHKHSKVLFGAFTLIIIVSFMGFLTPGQFGCSGSDGGDQKIGEAYGKKVTVNDLQAFYNKYSAGLGRENLEWNGVFMLYCLNARADQLGICVSDDEVAKAISREFVGADGKFDKKKYLETLKKNGVGEEAYAEAIRLHIKQEKLQEFVASQVVVTPSEVREAYRDYNTELHFKAASFSPESIKAPGKDELKKFFDANKDKYRCVKIAEFPIAAGNGKKTGEKDPAADARKKANDFLGKVRKAEAAKRAAAFDEVAKEQKIKVRPVVWVAADGENNGGVKADDLAVKVFNVTVRNPLAPVVVGEKAAYAVCLTDAAGKDPVVQAKAILEKHWRVDRAMKMAAEETARLNKIADPAAREKEFLKLGKTGKAKIADETVPNGNLYMQLQMYRSIMNRVDQQGQAHIQALINDIGNLRLVRKGGCVMRPDGTIYLLVKRELPAAEKAEKISKENEAFFRSVCLKAKTEAAWAAFVSDVMSNCKFSVKQEGRN